jgi:hypothetical protein
LLLDDALRRLEALEPRQVREVECRILRRDDARTDRRIARGFAGDHLLASKALSRFTDDLIGAAAHEERSNCVKSSSESNVGSGVIQSKSSPGPAMNPSRLHATRYRIRLIRPSPLMELNCPAGRPGHTSLIWSYSRAPLEVDIPGDRHLAGVCSPRTYDSCGRYPDM